MLPPVLQAGKERALRRTLEVLALTLFQHDASSGRILFLGCPGVIAIARLEPHSAVQPAAVIGLFDWTGVHTLLRSRRMQPLLQRPRTAHHTRSERSGRVCIWG